MERYSKGLARQLSLKGGQRSTVNGQRSLADHRHNAVKQDNRNNDNSEERFIGIFHTGTISSWLFMANALKSFLLRRQLL
jgi:hypothetical protein